MNFQCSICIVTFTHKDFIQIGVDTQEGRSARRDRRPRSTAGVGAAAGRPAPAESLDVARAGASAWLATTVRSCGAMFPTLTASSGMGFVVGRRWSPR